MYKDNVIALATNDCLTRFDGKQNAYDAIGNPEGYKGWSLQWNERRLLSQAIIPKGSVSGANWTVNFAYNANGQRTQKTFTEYGTTVTTTEYLYNGDKLAGQQSSNGKTLTFLYDHNGEYIGLDYNGTEYYYIKNLQGDVIAIADATGTIVGTYTYSAWGEVYYMTGLSSSQIYEFTDNIVAINPIRYRGYYYDAETGLYYLNSRYYDPSTGRFVNSDGYVSGTGESVQGYNLFLYCHNNPVNMNDHSGNWPNWIKNVVNAITSVAKTVAKVVTTKTSKKTAIVKTSSPSSTSSSIVNHSNKTHVTTPSAMLDGGPLLGKIGFSATTTFQDKDPGLFHSYADIGNDASKYGVGINAIGWLGLGLGASSNANIFANAQVTPWIHAKVSVGLDGVGGTVGLNIDNTSYDFEIKGGWGLIVIFATGMTPAGVNQAPAY